MQTPSSLLAFTVFLDEPEPRDVAIRLGITAVMCAHSAWLVRFLESAATHYNEAPLPRWRRYLIPLPMLLLLANVLVTIMRESPAFAKPGHFINPAEWNPDWFGNAGLILLTALPFLLVWKPLRALRLSLFVWCMHFLWGAVSWLPFVVTTLKPVGLFSRD